MEEAITEFKKLSKNSVYSIIELKRWLLKFEKEFSRANSERILHTCCFADLPCEHTLNSLDSKFSNFYGVVRKIVHLHRYENYAGKELDSFNMIISDPTKIREWVIKNQELGSERLICFFLDYLDYHKDDSKICHLHPYQNDFPDLEIFVNRNDFKNLIAFTELFNELFWVKKIYPEGLPKLNREVN